MKLLRRHLGVVAIILKKKGACTSINLCQNCILYCAVMVYFILHSYTKTFFYCFYCKFMPELYIVLCCYGIFYFALIHQNIFLLFLL